MNERKGIILERDDRGYLVISQGEFLRLRADVALEAGDEVSFGSESVLRDAIGLRERFSGAVRGIRGSAWGKALEVAAVLMLVVGIGFNGKGLLDKGNTPVHKGPRVNIQAVDPAPRVAAPTGGSTAMMTAKQGNPGRAAIAYVTVDINPSIEMGVDDSGMVVSAKGLNNDGIRVLAEAGVTGMDLDKAVEAITQIAMRLGYLGSGRDNEILLAGAPAGEGSDDHLEKDLEMARKAAFDSIQTKDPTLRINVAAMAVSHGVRAKATAANLSMGKYIVMGGVRNAGVKLSAEQLRRNSLRKVLKTAGLDMTDIVREYMKGQIAYYSDGATPGAKGKPNAAPGQSPKTVRDDGKVKGQVGTGLDGTVIELPTMKYSDLTADERNAINNNMGKPVRFTPDGKGEATGGIVVQLDVLSTGGTESPVAGTAEKSVDPMLAPAGSVEPKKGDADSKGK